MSNADNYAPGTYSDPNAPWNQPEPIEDTDAFQDKKVEIWDERISDPAYFMEAIGEMDEAAARRLATYVRDNQTGTYTTSIGAAISACVTNYCEPEDDDVISELEKER